MSTVEGIQGPPIDEDAGPRKRIQDVGPGLLFTVLLGIVAWFAVVIFCAKVIGPKVSLIMAAAGH